MKKKLLAVVLAAMTAMTMVACGSAQPETGAVTTEETVTEEATEEASDAASEESTDGAVYNVGIVQYVDDASLNQIEKAIEAELDAKAAELGVTFNYADHTYNGQADATTLNQIATDLVADGVDIIVPIATPTAMIMQNATEDNQIPVVFSAVSDPVGAGLVASMDAPGSNITGTSDALDTNAIFDLMVAANADIKKVGLLYDKSQDSSTAAIEAAKSYCADKGIEVVEKTGTTNEEVSLAADALVAAGVEAIFTPSDNTIMTAELAIFEKFTDAKIPHYTGADSFALNGAFLGYGVNYEELGTVTADMVVDILTGGEKPESMAVRTLQGGIATVNTETAEAVGIDYKVFEGMCDKLNEIQTAENFE